MTSFAEVAPSWRHCAESLFLGHAFEQAPEFYVAMANELIRGETAMSRVGKLVLKESDWQADILTEIDESHARFPEIPGYSLAYRNLLTDLGENKSDGLNRLAAAMRLARRAEDVLDAECVVPATFEGYWTKQQIGFLYWHGMEYTDAVRQVLRMPADARIAIRHSDPDGDLSLSMGGETITDRPTTCYSSPEDASREHELSAESVLSWPVVLQNNSVLYTMPDYDQASIDWHNTQLK